MDCMDVVIGVSKNGLGRVADYYTRDRSTPRLDSVWVGCVFSKRFGTERLNKTTLGYDLDSSGPTN